jgi:hypothetical protein
LHIADGITPIPWPGFSLVASITGANGIYVYTKLAGASEPANYEIYGQEGIESQGAISAIYSDIHASVAVKVDVVSSRTNASGDRVWDEVTTTVANTLLACFGSLENQDSAPHSGMDERYDTGTARVYLMTQDIASAGATGSRTATGTSAASKCVAVAFSDAPLRVTVTQAGAYAELGGESVRMTLAGAYAELSPAQVRVTQSGGYAELTRRQIRATQLGTYVELAGSEQAAGLCSFRLPDTLNDGLRYRFHHPAVLAKSGGRTPVFERWSEATLEWRSVTQEDWDWMVDTVLAGAESRRCTGGNTLLWNREMYLKAWDNAVIHYPQSEIRDGEHKDVRLRVSHLFGESDP